jgi:hypothetical protein
VKLRRRRKREPNHPNRTRTEPSKRQKSPSELASLVIPRMARPPLRLEHLRLEAGDLRAIDHEEPLADPEVVAVVVLAAALVGMTPADRAPTAPQASSKAPLPAPNPQHLSRRTTVGQPSPRRDAREDLWHLRTAKLYI